MMEASPPAALEMVEPELVLELLIVALDAPAQLGGVDEIAQGCLGGQAREPVLRRLGLAFRPFDKEPLFWPRRAAPIVAMGRPDPDGGEARGERGIAPLAPGDGAPSGGGRIAQLYQAR